MPDILSSERIRQNLNTTVFGQTVYYVPQIDSTNVALKQLAAAGAPEGTLYIADEQTAGRARFSRTWQAAPGSSLLMSLLFRPTFLLPTQAQQLTMICALAALEAIAAQTGLVVSLKWPNDLVYEGRKLAGVLTELGFAGDQLDWIIVGMGLNVNADFTAATTASPHDLPLARVATSLQMILGQPVPRLALLQAYLLAVEGWYQRLQTGESPHQTWSEQLVTLGQNVTISGLGDTLEGIAEGVDAAGALLVRMTDGRLERVTAGDVSLRQS